MVHVKGATDKILPIWLTLFRFSITIASDNVGWTCRRLRRSRLLAAQRVAR